MLLVSHKVVFIENEVVLLCVIMRNVQGHLQLQPSVLFFHIAFAIIKFGFCGAFFKRILEFPTGFLE